MQSDRLLSIAGGVAFFVLFAIFPAITALVSAYGIFFNASTIGQDLSLLQDVVPANVLGIRHRAGHARIAASSGMRALSIGVVVGILVSLWSAMSGVKAMIDALNVIYEQQESRNLIKLNLCGAAVHPRRLCGFPACGRAPSSSCRWCCPESGLAGESGDLIRIAALAGAADCAARPASPCSTATARIAAHARWQWVSVGSVFASRDVDRGVVPVLLVPRQASLPTTPHTARWVRCIGHDDVAVDLLDGGAARRRTEFRDRTSDCAGFQRLAMRNRWASAAP